MACLKSISTGPWSAHSFNKDPCAADIDDRTNIQVLSRAQTSGPDDQTLDRFKAHTHLQHCHSEMSMGQKNCCLLALLGALYMTKHQYRLVLKLNFFQGPGVTTIAPNR